MHFSRTFFFFYFDASGPRLTLGPRGPHGERAPHHIHIIYKYIAEVLHKHTMVTFTPRTPRRSKCFGTMRLKQPSGCRRRGAFPPLEAFVFWVSAHHRLSWWVQLELLLK